VSKLLDGERDGRRILAGALALAGLVVLAVLHASCGNPYLTAYRTLATARATAETTRDTLGQVCHLKRVKCLETHGAGTPAYVMCWDDCRKAERAWVDYIRPAVNSGLLAGLGAIQTAEAVKGKVDIIAMLKPIVCAIGAGVTQWGHLLPPSVKADLMMFASIAAAATCPKVTP
jgi:hypothetical protein